MNVKDALVAARAKIAQGWCQDASARSADGHTTEPTDPTAISWCILGAIDSLDVNDVYWPTVTLLSSVNLADNGLGLLSIWNDEVGRTQEQVLTLFDRAIAVAVT